MAKSKKPADPPKVALQTETGGGAGVDETQPTLDATSDGPAGDSGDSTDTPPEPTPTETPDKPKTKRVSVKDGRVPDGPVFNNTSKPNTPSFDFDPDSGEPNLNGEEILVDAVKQDVRIVLTNGGRQIYCCSIAEYLKKFGALPVSPEIYAFHYPQAT